MFQLTGCSLFRKTAHLAVRIEASAGEPESPVLFFPEQDCCGNYSLKIIYFTLSRTLQSAKLSHIVEYE